MKICCRCRLEKDESLFGKDNKTNDKLTYACKKCRNKKFKEWYYNNPNKVREMIERDKPYRKDYYNKPEIKLKYQLKRIEREFRLKSEDYLKMVEEQNNQCAICNNEEISTRNKNLCIDHCHKTDKIRGLLCNKCNRAIGLLQDSPEILQKAINYLKKYQNAD